MILQVSMMALNVHEATQLVGMHEALRSGDVLLGDRAFCSFGHLILLGKLSVDAVFRMSAGQIIDFTPGRAARKKTRRKKKNQASQPSSHFIARLGDHDQIVEWFKPAKRPVWMSLTLYASLPPLLRVRELRYRINAKGMRSREITITTTLLDPMRYPKREIIRLYQLRWEIETNFGHLKTTMKMEHLKCKTPEGVIKELMVFALVYNLIRSVMIQAAARQQLTDANRVSLIDASRWLCVMLTPLSINDAELTVNPLRPGRQHPRVKKRRMNAFSLMTKPRSAYLQTALNETINN